MHLDVEEDAPVGDGGLEELSARALITIEQLGRGLVWAYDVHELADEPWVDVPTVRTRLATLTSAEGRYLEELLDLAEVRFNPEQPVGGPWSSPRAARSTSPRTRATPKLPRAPARRA